jgi:hypothetical protein
MTMRHIQDDDMVLHYYGEGDDRRAVEGHLLECAACRERFESLSSDMTTMGAVDMPERGDDYGASVWARIQPRLEAAPTRRWWASVIPARVTWPRLAFAGSVASLIVAAFIAGRYWQAPAVPPGTQAQAPAAVVRERILLVAVGEHLERSRVILAEISNRTNGEVIDLSPEQAVAQDLVATNRLYRQAAVSSGDPAMASLLEELGRTLAEIANSPSMTSADGLARLRDRIESQGLLFKVTVFGSQVKQRQRDAVAPQTIRVGAST